ncbi:MAG: hypothetical protein ABF976_14720 [Acetobacter syzygii]|nr:hypothetical protein [Acetobacter lambici]NHO58228.1 hypothetical protein [Acetobacter lambici]
MSEQTRKKRKPPENNQKNTSLQPEKKHSKLEKILEKKQKRSGKKP